MDFLQQQSLTGCLSKATLAAGTTTTMSTTGTTTYAIKGKAYTSAAKTNSASPTTDFATGLAFPALSANQGTVVVVGYDSAGSSFRAVQGTIQALDVGGAFINAPQMPYVPDTMCPIGYIVLKAGSTLASTFTFGTNNLSGVTGMTYTFVDVALGLPDRPQIS